MAALTATLQKLNFLTSMGFTPMIAQDILSSQHTAEQTSQILVLFRNLRYADSARQIHINLFDMSLKEIADYLKLVHLPFLSAAAGKKITASFDSGNHMLVCKNGTITTSKQQRACARSITTRVGHHAYVVPCGVTDCRGSTPRRPRQATTCPILHDIRHALVSIAG